MRPFALSLLISAAVVALPLTALAQESAPPPSDVQPAPEAAPVRPAIPAEWSPVPETDEGRSAYGLYLAGRAALRSGQPEAGAEYLQRVQSLTPEQPTVREQAFITALLAGDLAAAARTPAQDLAPGLGGAAKLVQVVETFAAGDARGALARLNRDPVAAPHLRAARFLTSWVAAAAGDWTTALEPLPPGVDAATVTVDQYHRALLLEARGTMAEAEATYQGLIAQPRTAPRFRRAYGEFLERRGRRADAIAQYDLAIAADPDNATLVRDARARAAAGGKPTKAPNLREGAALALGDAAALAMVQDNAQEYAVIYYRLSQRLDDTDLTRYLLARALDGAGLTSAARAELAAVGRDEPRLYTEARVSIGLGLARDGKQEAALAAFREAAEAAPLEPRTASLVASQLMTLERYEEALEVLNGPLLNVEDQGPDIRFLRGAAYESLGRIPEAEAELWAALQARPDDPTTLNYLGYLWVDQGRRVAEGAEMIARAHAAQPENGNIQDSLGWAQYRQGQYETAVETLEAAVAKEPANAEINDHLGDAYWQVGRRREAAFQWTRVLTLDPDAERRASVEAKLARGLEAGTAGSQP